MISAHIDGIEKTLLALSGQAKQVEYAEAVARHRVGHAVRQQIETEIAAGFDRPTPWFQKSVYVRPYKPIKGADVAIFIKDVGAGASASALAGLRDTQMSAPEPGSTADILGHHFSGGSRKRKKIEEAFTRAGLIKGHELLVPGPDARLDRYGNISRGQVQQMYAALYLYRDPNQNRTRSRRSQRNDAAAGRMFWSNGDHPMKVRRGLWATSRSKQLQLLLIPIPQAVYRKRIDMPAIAAQRVAADFDREFRVALQQALSTARP